MLLSKSVLHSPETNMLCVPIENPSSVGTDLELVFPKFPDRPKLAWLCNGSEWKPLLSCSHGTPWNCWILVSFPSSKFSSLPEGKRRNNSRKLLKEEENIYMYKKKIHKERPQTFLCCWPLPIPVPVVHSPTLAVPTPSWIASKQRTGAVFPSHHCTD